jgi:hypothetical protein
MILTQVGFIAQLKGTLTKKRYTAATIFVDHNSRLKYVHLMTRLTSEETIEAKQAFEHFAKQHGIRILHYHCNNGQFADRLQEQLQCKGATSHLLWGQHPLPKRHHRKSHQGPPRERTEAAPPCAPMMAGCHSLGPLAICPQERRSPPQYFTCFGGWYLKARAF